MRLVRGVIGLWLLLVAISALTILVSRRQPPSAPLSGLYLEQCAPACWNGVKLGVTSLNEAQQLLSAQFNGNADAQLYQSPGLLVIDFQREAQRDPCLQVILEGSPSHPMTIEKIALLTFPRADCPVYSLADMLLWFGTPDHFVTNIEPDIPRNPSLFYAKSPSAKAWILLNYYPPGSPIGNTFLRSMMFYTDEIDFDAQIPFQKWRGMAHYHRW